MKGVAQVLHGAFIRALGASVLAHSPLSDKPLSLDLALPCPPRLRVYLYSLVSGRGTVRSSEYKCVLRLRGQPIGEYASFDQSGGRFVIVAGYRPDLDVFVLWDAVLHPRFKSGVNIQVRDSVVHAAAASGRAEQIKLLPSGATELVIACQSPSLASAIDDRIAWTGGYEVR
ncbi:hypothetical protein [Bradyrhizobium aeschynomenes]|uniref:hypothetical protein n=1 Tax=Bradyrhizobium aeschynomenes TaxID=2734909 RepID=UPI003D32282E